MTRASDRLAKLQRETPPSTGSDRAAPMLAMLVPAIGGQLEGLVQSGHLVLGEVGEPTPNATTLHFPDGSHLIVCQSGLLDFMAATADLLFGATNVYLGDGTVIRQVGTMGSVVSRLVELFRPWKLASLPGEPPAASPRAVLPPEVGADAALLAQMATLFVMSHELGHVLHAETMAAGGAERMTREEEFAADATGMRVLVNAGNQRGMSRIHYAGAVVALRVFAVLQSLGHVFTGDHPPPLDRLAALQQSARTFAATLSDYYKLIPIATAFDEQMETASVRLRGVAQEAPLTVERIVSRVRSALEEVQTERVPLGEIETMFHEDIRDAPPDILPAVAETAATLFGPGGDAALGPLFAACVATLPPAGRQVFPDFHDLVAGP